MAAALLRPSAVAGLAARFSAAMQSCSVSWGHSRLAVAVSGGPDSMVLAALVAGWDRAARREAGGAAARTPAPVALVVDHRLRPESAAEAKAVAARIASLGLQPHVLEVEWESPPREQDKMAVARDARYNLLRAACKRLGRSHLLVGHHADDQAETFLLRLVHASGVHGLSCMAPVAQQPLEGGGVLHVVRPLLGMHKRELEQYCQATGLQYVVDPTNAKLLYPRNRLRWLIQQEAQREAAAAAAAAEAADPAAAAASAAAAAAAEAKAAAAKAAAEAEQWGRQPNSIWQGNSAKARSLAAPAAAAAAGAGRGVVRQASSPAVLAPYAKAPTLPVPQQQHPQKQPPGQQQQQQQVEEPQLVRDLLRLQHRCRHAYTLQQAQAQQLLQRAVMFTSLPGLPSVYGCKGRQRRWHGPRRGSSRTAGDRSEQPWWFIEWHERLGEMASRLGGIPFALVHVPRLSERSSDIVVLGALSQLLQMVAGRDYPTALPVCLKLQGRLAGGGLEGAFAGGGCMLRPLTRSKGRYVLAVPQHVEAAAQAAISGIPFPRAENGREQLAPPMPAQQSEEQPQEEQQQEAIGNA